MERKIFLDLCKKYCMGDKNVFVKCCGKKYNPVAYELTFDPNGNTVHYVYLRSKDEVAVRKFLDEIEEA